MYYAFEMVSEKVTKMRGKFSVIVVACKGRSCSHRPA